MKVSFWLPLLLGAAFLALGFVLPGFGLDLPEWVRIAVVTLSLMLIGVGYFLAQSENRKARLLGGHGGSAESSATTLVGGRGGDAKVGGSGTAIGGPGGHASKYGRGGDGGSAEVAGDGIAAGGAGGSSDGDAVWRPPAPSGYEVHMAATGQPIDPKQRKYGRGGMSAGYAARYRIVEQIRAEYFRSTQRPPIDAVENVHAVPLDFVNQKLAERGILWRARIVRDLDYEFYLP